MHQLGVFPLGGEDDYVGPTGNLKCVSVPYGANWGVYAPLLKEKAVPFLKEFEPDLVIVSAGYDALASDELANVQLAPEDYRTIAEILNQNFGSLVFGLEGGYNLRDLPLAVEQTLHPYL